MLEKTFQFHCPNCSGVIEGQREWAGSQAECPFCASSIVIPMPPFIPSTDTANLNKENPLLDTTTTRIKFRRPNAQKETIRKRIVEMPNLPTIPANVMKALGMLRDPNVEVNKVIDVINRDQILVAEILKLVNSSYYSMRSKVSTVAHAINLLGFKSVVDLLYSTSVMQIISPNDKILWKHCLSSSVLMGNMLDSCHIAGISGNLRLTTLMHDIGQVVFTDYDAVRYRHVRAESAQHKTPLSEVESKVFEIEHGEAGGWLLETWKMPEEVVIPILYHHVSTLPPCNIVETALLQLVDWIDTQVRGMPREAPPPELFAAAGLDGVDVAAWASAHAETIRQADASM